MFDQTKFDQYTKDIESDVKKGIKATLIVVAVGLLIGLGTMGTVVWVIYHFLSKVW
jgi:hypothetical protein